jgi:hypothetical protein
VAAFPHERYNTARAATLNNIHFAQTGGLKPPVVVFMPQTGEISQRIPPGFTTGTLFKHVMETVVMNTDTKQEVMKNDSRDDFKPGATIAVLTLLLAFIASSVYILITGYLNIA